MNLRCDCPSCKYEKQKPTEDPCYRCYNDSEYVYGGKEYNNSPPSGQERRTGQMNKDEKSYVTTIKDYITVKPDGHVVICRQDMHTGKVRVMPLMVDLDGRVCVVENTQMDGGQDNGTA